MTEITLPEGLAHIGSHAFEECKHLRIIEIPGMVKLIERASFSFCFALSHVILNEGTERIEAGAFAGCQFLKDIIIPASVVSIEPTALLPKGISLTIYCHENSYAHTFAQEHDIQFILMGDTPPDFGEMMDVIPGTLRIEGDELGDKLTGDPEIAKLLEQIARMVGPVIVKGSDNI